jgi:hypothetical protein
MVGGGEALGGLATVASAWPHPQLGVEITPLDECGLVLISPPDERAVA